MKAELDFSKARVVSDHIVGNLIFNMERAPILFDKLAPESMRLVAAPEPAQVYSELARIMKSPNEPFTFGSLEAGLRAIGFNFNYLAKLQQRVENESIETLCSYADLVNNSVEVYRAAQAINEAQTALGDPNVRANEVKARLVKQLSEAESSVPSVFTSQQVGEQLLEQLQLARDGVQVGVRTGLTAFDEIFQAQPGNLITIAARPSQGKTSTILAILYSVAKHIHEHGLDEQVVFFTADDTKQAGLLKIACACAGVNSNHALQGPLGGGKDELLDNWIRYLMELPLLWDETSNPTSDHIYYRCAMLNAQKKIRMACMDYVQLMKDPKARGETEEIRNSFSSLKGTGKTLGFPFFALSQLGKAVESRPDKFPTPSDLLHAGEAESDVCVTLVRPEHYILRGEDIVCHPSDEEGILVANIGKNKVGAIGKRRIGFKKEFSQAYNAEHSGYKGL